MLKCNGISLILSAMKRDYTIKPKPNIMQLASKFATLLLGDHNAAPAAEDHIRAISSHNLCGNSLIQDVK